MTSETAAEIDLQSLVQRFEITNEEYNTLVDRKKMTLLRN